MQIRLNDQKTFPGITQKFPHNRYHRIGGKGNNLQINYSEMWPCKLVLFIQLKSLVIADFIGIGKKPFRSVPFLVFVQLCFKVI